MLISELKTFIAIALLQAETLENILQYRSMQGISLMVDIMIVEGVINK